MQIRRLTIITLLVLVKTSTLLADVHSSFENCAAILDQVTQTARAVGVPGAVIGLKTRLLNRVMSGEPVSQVDLLETPIPESLKSSLLRLRPKVIEREYPSRSEPKVGWSQKTFARYVRKIFDEISSTPEPKYIDYLRASIAFVILRSESDRNLFSQRMRLWRMTDVVNVLGPDGYSHEPYFLANLVGLPFFNLIALAGNASVDDLNALNAFGDVPMGVISDSAFANGRRYEPIEFVEHDTIHNGQRLATDILDDENHFKGWPARTLRYDSRFHRGPSVRSPFQLVRLRRQYRNEPPRQFAPVDVEAVLRSLLNRLNFYSEYKKLLITEEDLQIRSLYRLYWFLAFHESGVRRKMGFTGLKETPILTEVDSSIRGLEYSPRSLMEMLRHTGGQENSRMAYVSNYKRHHARFTDAEDLRSETHKPEQLKLKTLQEAAERLHKWARDQSDRQRP